jgi:hypothetical protein
MCDVAWCGLCDGGCKKIGVVWVFLKSFGDGGAQQGGWLMEIYGWE